jgi:hypothetical protein
MERWEEIRLETWKQAGIPAADYGYDPCEEIMCKRIAKLEDGLRRILAECEDTTRLVSESLEDVNGIAKEALGDE